MTDFEWLDSGPNCSEGHYSMPFQNPHSGNPVLTTASSTDDAIAAMERCVNEIRAWMLCDKLKINDGKTEFVIIGTRQQLSKVHVDSLAVGDAQVSPVRSVKNLGTWIDSNMSLQVNINNTCKAAYYYITNVRRIRKYLSNKQLRHLFMP